MKIILAICIFIIIALVVLFIRWIKTTRPNF